MGLRQRGIERQVEGRAAIDGRACRCGSHPAIEQRRRDADFQIEGAAPERCGAGRREDAQGSRRGADVGGGNQVALPCRLPEGQPAAVAAGDPGAQGCNLRRGEDVPAHHEAVVGQIAQG